MASTTGAGMLNRPSPRSSWTLGLIVVMLAAQIPLDASATESPPLSLHRADSGPSAGGYSSDNVEHVAFLPFAGGVQAGATFYQRDGKPYMVLSGTHGFSIYNLSDPLLPTPLGVPTVTTHFRTGPHDIATNGKIMLVGGIYEDLGVSGSAVQVWDITDPAAPVRMSTVKNASNVSCLLECKYATASLFRSRAGLVGIGQGMVIDLRDPAKPKTVSRKVDYWYVTEIAPGVIVNSRVAFSDPEIAIIDASVPSRPSTLARYRDPPPPTESASSNLHDWPRRGRDRWMMGALSTDRAFDYGFAECNRTPLLVFDMRGWSRTGGFEMSDNYSPEGFGTITDGNPAHAAPGGCGPSGFSIHPSWRDGGLVAAGFSAHGTRFLKVDKEGSIGEVGWFLPNAGATSGAYWVDDEIVYAIDYRRGIDILRFRE